MAQATRCPHCQTAFKVVRDQLLLREGWVRCGHCGEAFNALDHLIDLTPPAQPQPPSEPVLPPAAEPTPSPAEPQAETPEPSAQTSTVPLAAGLRWSPVALESPAYPGLMPLTVHAYDLAPASPWSAPEQQGMPPPEAVTEDHAKGDEYQDATGHPPPAEPAPNVAETDAAPLSEFNLNEALNYRFDNEEGRDPAASAPEAQGKAPEPEFLRKARRQAFWSSKPTRLALAVLSLVLLGVLAAQAALQWRDPLAQQWPASRPWLQQLCAMTTGCELAAPRDLDALVIDSSGVSPAAQGLQLTVLLRNRVDRAVAWPALELTLNDAQGGIEQRKVVQPAQYLSPTQASEQALRAGLAAGQQVQLTLHVAVSGATPSGYKLVLFYP